MNTRELIEKDVANLPEALQREVFDFARFLRMKEVDAHFGGLLLSDSGSPTESRNRAFTRISLQIQWYEKSRL